MAIQISGTTVVDNSRNITNFESISGNGIATQAEAESGTNNNQFMTPLRVSQAIDALAGGGMKDDDINWSTCNVGCSVRGGGNVIYKSSGIIWIVAPSTAQVSETFPMAYCNGSGSSVIGQATRITGRDGWFIPDYAALQTTHACRAYWDTYSNYRYWSSTSRGNDAACGFCLGNGTGINIGKGAKLCIRPLRVVCYT